MPFPKHDPCLFLSCELQRKSFSLKIERPRWVQCANSSLNFIKMWKWTSTNNEMCTLFYIHTYADYLLCCQEPRPGASSSQCVPTTVLRQKTTSRLLYWENHKGESHLVADRPELNQSIIIQVLFYLLSYFIVNAIILVKGFVLFWPNQIKCCRKCWFKTWK